MPAGGDACRALRMSRQLHVALLIYGDARTYVAT